MTGLPYLVASRISAHLSAIAAEFRPGAKLTLLVRNDLGDDRDADAVMTDDTLPAAIAALEHRYAALLASPAGIPSSPDEAGEGASGPEGRSPAGPDAEGVAG